MMLQGALFHIMRKLIKRNALDILFLGPKAQAVIGEDAVKDGKAEAVQLIQKE